MASTEEIRIDTVNAAAELKIAESKLATYGKLSKEKKGRYDKAHPGYKKDLLERIQLCKDVIARATINPNAPTMSGSPNDPPPMPGTGEGETHGQEGSENARAAEDAIDPSLREPPTKRPRTNRHRKIEMPDPLDAIADSIKPRMLTVFEKAWLAAKSTVLSADDSSPLDSSCDSLVDAATDIIDHILNEAEQWKFPPESFNWTMEFDEGGQVTAAHIMELCDWLISSNLMVGERVSDQKTAKKPAKAAEIKIYEGNKRITMTPSMLIEARTRADQYRGVVEAGMDTVHAVLKNRNGRYKCISCDRVNGGAGGKKLDTRLAPPVEDHPYLQDCKCPLRGAALELWMLKMTVHDERVPKRADNDISARKLAFNPDTLKIVAGAIEAASGHDVPTLLQPEVKRLEHTALWALTRLKMLAEADDSDSSAASFGHLAKRLRETMEHWAKEN
ncbi:hypothetical protein MSAN_00225900 [Mycena sanguinolenta]|uniref:Uncharacterized protein n=1 Tax=Mycena sanguinolenta TaxID=230812 RepID=A0A8H6ZM54_9AGAR|nr:hypothetical protein MSAN_00225900 [Mycena sanguinolenta]